jgi:hypothetical protein
VFADDLGGVLLLVGGLTDRVEDRAAAVEIDHQVGGPVVLVDDRVQQGLAPVAATHRQR